MSQPLIPIGTATGDSWQYRIERDGLFTSWIGWSEDLFFDKDPDGADFRVDAPYFFYARNPTIPPYSPGSIENELIRRFFVRADGRITDLIEAAPVATVSGADYAFKPIGSTVGAGWQYRLESPTASTTWIPWTNSLVFDKDPDATDLKTGVLYWLYSQNPNLPADQDGSTQSPLVTAILISPDGKILSAITDDAPDTFIVPTVPTLDEVAKSGLAGTRGKTDELVSLLGGLILGEIPVSVQDYENMLTIASDGIVRQQVIKNLLTLVQAAATSAPGKPKGDIPAINTIQFGNMTDANAALIAQHLLAIGFNTGSGSSGEGTPYEVLDDPRCFEEPVLAILDEAIENFHLQTRSVSYDKTDFVESGIQLFNKNSIYNESGQYINKEGTLVKDAGYTLSHRIPAAPFTAYTPNVPGQYVAFFDRYGTYLDSADFTRSVATFITPANTAYIRATVPNNTLEYYFLVKGDTLPEGPIPPFELYFKGKIAGQDLVDINARRALAEVRRGSMNLYNASDETNQNGYYIDNLGVPVMDAANTISHYIAVRPNTYYSPSFKGYVAYYDEKFNVTGTGALFDRASETFLTTSATRFIRVTVPANVQPTFTLVAGQVIPTAYIPFRSLLDSVIPLSDQALSEAYRADALVDLLTPGAQLLPSTGFTDGVYIDDDAVLHTLLGSAVSDFIPVLPNTTYTTTDKQYIAFYDSARKPLKGVRFDRASETFQTKPFTAYIRLTLQASQKSYYQLQRGNALGDMALFAPSLNVDTPVGTQGFLLGAQATRLLARLQAPNLFYAGHIDNKPNYYMDENGNLQAYAGLTLSHYIPVTPGGFITTTDKQYVAFFDARMRPLKGVRYDRASETFALSSQTAFIRATIDNTLVATYQIQAGTSLSSNPTNKAILDVETPTGTKAGIDSAAALKLANSFSSLVVFTEQLFDKSSPANRTGYYVDKFGNEFANAGNLVSHFIPVTPLTTYTPSFRAYVAYYDENFNTLLEGADYDRVDSNGNEIKSFTTTARAYYIKCTVPLNIVNSFMLAKGNAEVSYKPFGAFPSDKFQVGSVLSGKTIHVVGTSIPAQGGHYQLAGSTLGIATIIKAIPGSPIRLRNKDGSYAGNSYYATAYNLSATLAEKEEFMANYQTVYKPNLNPAFFRPDTLSDAEKAYIRSTSYESSVVPYLDGTYPMPDLFIIDHGFNDNTFPGDTDADWSGSPTNPLNRNTFIGAVNYLINEILKRQPRARIAFVSHYEHDQYPRITVAQQFLSDYHGLPILRLDEKMGWSQKKMPGTQALWSQSPYAEYSAGKDTSVDMSRLQFWLPDNLHIQSDPTGKARNLIAGFITTYLKEILF